MKITIIGAGNIGSAVAACLAKGHLYNEKDIIISTPHTDKLENLHKQFPAIRIMTENQYAISEADIIILAVKPCIVDEVLSPLRFSRTQILVSLVTGISISHLAHLSETEMPIFRVVPNIAITEHSSLTLITSRKAGKEHQQLIKQTFEEGGKCLVIPQGATFEIQDKRYVYKVVDGKAQSSQVQVTRVNGGREFIVDEGLSPGDVIVAEGVGLLREGTPIKAKTAQASTTTTEN